LGFEAKATAHGSTATSVFRWLLHRLWIAIGNEAIAYAAAVGAGSATNLGTDYGDSETSWHIVGSPTSMRVKCGEPPPCDQSNSSSTSMTSSDETCDRLRTPTRNRRSWVQRRQLVDRIWYSFGCLARRLEANPMGECVERRGVCRTGRAARRAN
jgi:hypothetical protein